MTGKQCITATVACLSTGGLTAAVPKGEVRLTAKALHPFWRTHPTPVGHEVDVNPPVLFWPSPRIGFTQPLINYDVELSRDAEFADIVERALEQHHSFFVPNRALEEGAWHWR